MKSIQGIEKRKLLKKVELFYKLSSKSLKKIEKITYTKHFKKEEYVFRESEEGNKLYIVVSGSVRIFKSSSRERIKTLALLKTGDFFGEMAILDKELRSANAQTTEDTELLVIDQESFKAVLKSNSEILFNIIETLCSRLRQANNQIETLAFQNIVGRTATALLDLTNKSGVKTEKGTKIDMEITHQALADLVGTAREIITKVLSNFKKNGYISVDEHYITILDKEKLKDTIC